MATRLQLLIDGDASGARRALDDVAGGVDQAQSKLGKFNGAMSKATVPAAATVASLAAVGKASFDSASALEQSAGAVESVFGTYAGQVEAQALQPRQVSSTPSRSASSTPSPPAVFAVFQARSASARPFGEWRRSALALKDGHIGVVA